MVVLNEPVPPAIPLWPWGFAGVGAVAVAAVLVAPLAAYVFLIALFGLPHILCEMRYCDQRFSARVPPSALWLVGGLILGVAGIRIGEGTGLVTGGIGVPVELALGIGLTVAALWVMRAHRAWGIVAGLAIAAGAAFAPIATFLTVAWLHNLTPLGFVAEIVPARERGRWLATLAVPFLLLPALIATGWPQWVIAHALGYSPVHAPSLFGAGRTPMGAFLPASLAFDRALPLFAAAVVAQSMHYLGVIAVLPRLLKRYGGAPEGASLVAWPNWQSFYFAVAVAALVFFAGNAFDYGNAKLFYGVAAAMHAWVELPILLIALGAGFTAVYKGSRPSPTTQS